LSATPAGFTDSFAAVKKTIMQEPLRPVVENPENLPVHDEFDSRFRPTGAIAFFIALVITGLVIWFGIYFLMLERI
jgi:hypothetical protein